MHTNTRRNTICYMLVLSVLALAAGRGTAAEFRLRAQCVPAGPVVTLGDIADIGSTDGAGHPLAGPGSQAAVLAAVELFPSPVAPEEKTLRVREIQDLLVLHGVNLAEHQLSGASEVVIQAAAARPQAAAVKPVPAAMMQRTKRRVEEALVKYLNEQSASQQTWSLEFELTETAARMFADPVLPIQVTGGNAPWTGAQRFDVAVNGSAGPAHASIEAHVRIVLPVVVALRTLGRGEVIREGDVELRQVAADKQAGTMHTLNEAVGHELLRAVGTGVPVTTDTLRPPLAVHRGEVVTVLARAGGVRIRTNARARDEGSVGELVAVESLLNRSTYYTRVTGNREVEVYARPPQVENEPSGNATAGSFINR